MVVIKSKHPSRNNKSKYESTSNIIFNLSQMGIHLQDAFFIELDTYFELVDLYYKQNSDGPIEREASQTEIDNFLM